jgi:hypothetical protein
MGRNNQRLHPAIINLINEGSVFRQDVIAHSNDDIDKSETSAETTSQTYLEKIKGGISRLALGDTVEQPEN